MKVQTNIAENSDPISSDTPTHGRVHTVQL